MILLDTSGILSALFPDQNRHEECARALLAADPPRILSPFVLTEVDYLVQKFSGVESELLFLAEVGRRAYELAPFSEANVEEARQVVLKYRGLRIGLADASIVVLSRRYGALEVLTLDERHFRAIRPTGRKTFRILPADGA